MTPFSASIRKAFAKVFARRDKRGHSPIFSKFRLEELEPRDVPATFYVATTGSNSAVGDSNNPWRTLQHAADQVDAGDTVIIRTGTYVGFEITTDGTATNRIVFKADSGVTVNAKLSSASAYSGAINLEGADYVTIDGFNVTLSTYGSVRSNIRSVENTGAVIRNNVIDDASWWGILTGNSENLLIEGNRITDTKVQHGIYVANSADNPTLRNNYVANSRGAGIQINADKDLPGDGIISGAIVEGNTLLNNCSGESSSLNLNGVEDATIINNLIASQYRNGIAMYQDNQTAGTKNNLVAFNTIIGSAFYGISISGSGSTGNELYNNILFSQGWGSNYRGGLGVENISGLKSDYNILMGRVNRDPSDTESTSDTASQWQARGFDTHSIFLEDQYSSATTALSALFVTPPPDLYEPEQGEYQLKANSPAIDKGTTISGVTKDIDGDNRDTKPDIGAYEYGSSSTSSPRFQVSAPATATAGTSFTITVSALDSSDAVDTSYTGTVQFTSSDGQATLPANYTFTSGDQGTKTFTVTLKTAGSRTITATDTGTGSINGTDTITVSAAAANTMQVSAPSTATAGTASNVTVTLKDAYGNTATGYRGTVRLTSNDGQATLPANYTFTASNAGVHTFSVNLKTAGSRSVTVTDTATGSLTSNASVTVNHAAARTHQASAPTTTTAGSSFNVAVTVKDAYGNTATGYRGTVRLTSNDGQATLPANYTFTASDAGVHTFSVNLKTAGSRSVTVTDTATGSVNGSASLVVSAGTASVLQFAAPSNATANTAFNLTVTAKDAFGNTATGYRGTVGFISTDTLATLPANYTFLAGDNGVRTFSVTLKTLGSRSVIATDTAIGTITGTATLSVGSAPVSPPPAPPVPVPAPPAPPAALPAPPAPLPAPPAQVLRPMVVNAPAGTQVVRVLNSNGSTRLALTPHPGFTGGIVAAAGDVNGDGVADVVTAATFGGHVKVFDGTTLTEIRSFYAFPGYKGPINLATGDITGDGVADLIVAANLNGHVKVFDGLTNTNTISFFAYSGYQGPVAVGAADMNGDGRAELITAAEGTQGVHVKALAAGTLALQESFFATGPGPGGFSLSAGDLDGNGVAEFLVTKGSRVRVLDSITKEVRADFQAFDAGFPGRVTVQAAQGDDDALPELVAIAEALDRSHVMIYDGPGAAVRDSFIAGTR